MMYGLKITGECLGTKSTERNFKDKATGAPRSFTEHKLGIRVPKRDGFEGESEVISITLLKSHHDNNLHEYYDSKKSALVTVPVYIHAFSSANGHTGLETKLSGDGYPEEKED